MFSLASPEEKRKGRTLSKKKLPFKAPSPYLKRSQQPQISFLKRSSSSIEPIRSEKKKPLEFMSESQLNSSARPQLIKMVKSKSSLSQISNSNSFGEIEEIDLTQEDEEPPKNFKSSAPAGTLATKPTRDTTVHTLYTQRSSSQTFKPTVQLGSLKKNGQSTLNLGSTTSRSQPSSQKRTNPWANQPVALKNPRIKPTSKIVPTFHTKSASGKVLSDEQQHVLRLVVDSGKNVFYTGSAGTGKSLLLQEIVKRLRTKYTERAVAVTASTGLAAVNIGGQTINKFSGMGIGDKAPGAYVSSISRRAEVKDTWRRTKVLIIDEISMLDGKFLDKLDQVARGVRGNNHPFGGIQVVMTGDFFQLPPVPDRNQVSQFCFESKAWKHIHHTILLHQVFRQADSEFVDILNAIRVANISDEMAEKLRELSRDVHYDDGILPTELYATRNEVENSNRRRLAALKGIEVPFIAIDSGSEFDKKMLENTMAVKTLILKEDAQVMMLKNKDSTLVNGSLGIVLTFLTGNMYAKCNAERPQDSPVTDDIITEMRLVSRCIGAKEIPNTVITEINRLPHRRQETVLRLCTAALHDSRNEILPLVRFSLPTGGTRIDLVEREDFFVSGGSNDDKESSPHRSQIPLLLSWALSIHKSQGQTLPRVKVDLDKVFEAGQVYVSLSRAVSKESLQILNFRKEKIRAHASVKKFYESLEKY